MERRATQETGKQLVFFTDRAVREKCQEDVIKILIPTGKYCAHDLNFVNCFLNNTPPVAQRFILHWGNSHSQWKGFKQDVFEIITEQPTKDGEGKTVHYLIPVPVLFDALGLSNTLLPKEWFDENDSRDLWEAMVDERVTVYNDILGKYCHENGIKFHNLQGCVKKKTAYMRAVRI